MTDRPASRAPSSPTAAPAHLTHVELIWREKQIEHWIRFREEHDEQIKALKQLINLGNEYGLDLSRPAQTAQEAVLWTYMGYLASV